MLKTKNKNRDILFIKNLKKKDLDGNIIAYELFIDQLVCKCIII